MYKPIVVAVDGSRTSLLALKHATELAKMSNAKLSLITVANPTEFMALAPEFLQHESYEVAANSQGEEVLSQAEKIAKDEGLTDVNKEIIISTKGAKDMAEKLIQKAEDTDADLIVLGTHGRTGLMHLLMGSFAETVMRQSTLPLLILRSNQGAQDESEVDATDNQKENKKDSTNSQEK
ncbi:MAG: universal stress protein [Neisseriaceae bacterium]|nr:universal stress protein [Neisseriaceae bacterium]